MPEGYTHWYSGFVSPNNICGKLKFFIPRAAKPDLSHEQKIGALGTTLHSFWSPKIHFIGDLLKKLNIQTTKTLKNEFGENCFVFIGTDGVAWQIIEKSETKNKPLTTLEFKRTNN